MVRKRVIPVGGLVALLVLMGVGGGSALGAPNCPPKVAHPPLVQTGTLIGAINPTVPPIQYVDKDGKIVGLDVDLGNEIAKRLCLTMQFWSLQFATMIPGLKDGRFDMIDSFMFYTEERAAQVIMIPYGASTLGILVPRSNTEKITGPKDFSGKKFGVELGTVDAKDAEQADQELKAGGKPGIEVHTFANYSDVLQALRAGQVDGAFVGTEEAYYYQRQGQTFFRVALTGYDPHAEALAFKDRALADQVAAVLNQMKQDGSLDKIFAPYRHCLLPGPYQVTTGPLPPPNCQNAGG
ncbi:MAG TPA: ABC transporter substrate-binding protein [bacterium]|nr:ABC transporter substrate-binding protein [bacterium]